MDLEVMLHYFPTPDEVPSVQEDHHESPDMAVVVDVLRATTTIAMMLHHGAEAVETFADLEELRNAAAQYPADKKIMAGERGGIQIEDFDLGNSPAAISQNAVEGKRIFLSTTNGTRALARVRDVHDVFCAALPNRAAVADRIFRILADIAAENKQQHISTIHNVWLIGSGWENHFSLEDTLCVGAVASALINYVKTANTANRYATEIYVEPANDEMVAAMAVWEQWKDKPEKCLRSASHGKRLARIGNHDDDFACCSAVDTLTVVPVQTKPGVIQKA